MRPRIAVLCLAGLVLASSQSLAQTGRALIWDLGNGQHIGIVLTSDGQMVILTEVTIQKLEAPTPVTKVKRAMIVYESMDQGQELNQLFTKIRTNPDLSQKVPFILDKDATNENDQPLPLVQDALKEIGDSALPCVVGLDESGHAVEHKLLPATVAQVAQILKGWGL